MSLTVPADRRHYTTAEVVAITGFSRDTLCQGIRDRDPGVLALGPTKIRQTINWSRAAVDAAFPPITEVAA